MPFAQIKTSVENFISNVKNDVLLIRGEWGVGKTYFWQNTVKRLSEEGTVGHSSYIYVSLFGIDNLESLRNSLIASKVNSVIIGREQSTSFGNLIKDIRTRGKDVERIPILRNFTGGLLSSITFEYIQDTLICFDDLERKSDSLPIKDVLGLASILKEQKNCKIVFISNDGALEEKEQKLFSLYSEKLIDSEIKFVLNTDEIFDLIFENHPHYELIKEKVASLKIKNIRILQRIRNFIEELLPHLSDTQPTIISSAISTTILVVWSFYDKTPETIPLSFLESYSIVRRYARLKNEIISESEKQWEEFLELYPYAHTDEVDRQILLFIKNGYVDADALSEKLRLANDEISKQNGIDSYRRAWELYKSSFDNNEAEVVEALTTGFSSNVKHLSIINLDETARLLRFLNHDSEANQLIDEFLQNHFDKEGYLEDRKKRTDFGIPFIYDDYLIQKADELAEFGKSEEEKSLKEVIESIVQDGYITSEYAEIVSEYNSDDLYNYLKNIHSPYLYRYVKACLSFRAYDTEPYKTIAANFQKAFDRIASESDINRKRVSEYLKLVSD